MTHDPTSERQPSEQPVGSAPPTPELPPTLVAELRRTLRPRVVNVGADGDLRRTLHEITCAARERGLRAEQLVIWLKQQWAESPHGAPTDAGQTTLGRVIEALLDEYYGSW